MFPSFGHQVQTDYDPQAIHLDLVSGSCSIKDSYHAFIFLINSLQHSTAWKVFPGNRPEEEVITWELVIFQLNVPI